MTRFSQLAAAAGLLAATLAVAGCGVPSQQLPVRVDRTEVPYDLLDEAPPARSTPPANADPIGDPQAFFVTDDERLVGVPLTAPPSSSLPVAISALSSGPDRESRSRGLGTAIPPGLAVAVTRLERGIATIDLRGEPGPAGEQTPLAVAQIVLTATSVPTVDRVLLTRSGQPLEAQLPDGGLTTAPLTARDYTELLARP
jgi:hypothetical protein